MIAWSSKADSSAWDVPPSLVALDGRPRQWDAPMSEGSPLTLVTIQVPHLDKLLRLVEENGGSVLGAKRAIPRIGWFATCAEPGGLLFGMVQPDPLPTLRIGDLALTATRASDEAGERPRSPAGSPTGAGFGSSTAPTSAASRPRTSEEACRARRHARLSSVSAHAMWQMG